MGTHFLWSTQEVCKVGTHLKGIETCVGRSVHLATCRSQPLRSLTWSSCLAQESNVAMEPDVSGWKAILLLKGPSGGS